MAHDYKMVQWTPFKRTFDLALFAILAAFLATFIGASVMAFAGDHSIAPIQLLIRAFGACAFALLTFILMIGPLARLSRRFTPLLYNRRHLGVACFMLALTHAGLVLLWYHGFSDINPLVSLLISNPRYDSIAGFPFESLGLVALFVLFLMAATSHDFWNAVLGPRLWKALHMGVYWAYALLVAHIVLGAVQGEKGPLYAVLVSVAAGMVASLQLVAGAREARADGTIAPEQEGWLRVGAPLDIADGRARIVTPPAGERIAVFRDGAKIYALSNVCRHQGGPLGEGRIIDGCVTCPWHGFQYRPEDGVSPPPYAEKVAAYRTRIEAGIVFVHLAPAALGAAVAPSLIEAGVT